MPDAEFAHLIDRLMRRIQSSLNQTAPAFDTHRIGPGGGILLLTLAEIEPAPVQQLVAAMARDKSQMTRAVKALEAKGLITRKGTPNDARVSLLALTDEGHRTVKVLQRAVADALDPVLAPLEPEEQDQLRALLRRI